MHFPIVFPHSETFLREFGVIDRFVQGKCSDAGDRHLGAAVAFGAQYIEARWPKERQKTLVADLKHAVSRGPLTPGGMRRFADACDMQNASYSGGRGVPTCNHFPTDNTHKMGREGLFGRRVEGFHSLVGR